MPPLEVAASCSVTEPAPVRGVRLIDRGLIAYGRGLEHPGKIRLVRSLIRHLASGCIEVVQEGGAVITVDPADYVGWQIFKTGRYEPLSIALARRILTEEPGLFVDVGAHVGWFTFAIAPIVGARVISIEPDSANCAALSANVTRNGFTNVTVCNVAVAAEGVELVPLTRRSPGNSGTVAIASAQAAPGGRCGWVKAVTLQALLERLVYPPVPATLMKLDIEGLEPQALAGLDFDGAFRPGNILIELERTFLVDSWGSLDDFAEFWRAKGYVLADVRGRPFTADGEIPETNVWARDARLENARS